MEYGPTPDTPITRMKREQCERFIPALKHARLGPEYPVAQGLRSVRKGDVRIVIKVLDKKGQCQGLEYINTEV